MGLQARRRVAESGPAEASGECQRHEVREAGWEITSRGFSPSRKWGSGDFPREKYLNYRRLYVRFNVYWKLFGGQNFSHFGQ